MSTRASFYFEDEGVHVFHDYMEPDVDLWLEYGEGPFSITLPLSKKLSDVLRAGFVAVAERPLNPEVKTESLGRHPKENTQVADGGVVKLCPVCQDGLGLTPCLETCVCGGSGKESTK